MKLTISQEGANPITIKTSNGYYIDATKSEEGNIPSHMDDNPDELVSAFCGLTHKLISIIKTYFPKYPTYNSPTSEEIDNIAKLHSQEDIEKIRTNIQDTYVEIMNIQGFIERSPDSQTLISKIDNQMNSESFVSIIPSFTSSESSPYVYVIKDLLGYARAADRVLFTLKSKQISKEDAAKNLAARGALDALGGAAILALVTKVLGGTIYNNVTSIGTFNSGNDMFQHPQIKQKIQQISQKYNGNIPTIDEVKSDPNARSKSTFFGWLLGGSSNANVMQNVKTYNFLLKSVDGVPCTVTSITPMTFNSKRVLIATAYVKQGNIIKPVPLARGFLNTGSAVNASKESVNAITVSHNGKVIYKTK